MCSRLSRPEALNCLSHVVIGAAIEVHRALGPGLLKSAYLDGLCSELASRGVLFERQVEVPVRYKGRILNSLYRVDLVVDERLLVELKAVESLLPVHRAQLLTYLRLLGMPLGLLINFNVVTLASGVKRVVHGL